jgi:hypothetical protein
MPWYRFHAYLLFGVPMSLFKPALAAYFEKCGVDAADAKRVQARFGQNYSAMVQQMEIMGSKGDSKALAAVQIADDAFFTPSHYPDGPHWGYIESEDDIYQLIDTIRAAGICSIAIYNHAFGQDVVHDYADVFNRFLLEAQQQAQRRSMRIDISPLLARFLQDAQQLKAPRTSKGLTALFS